MLPRQQISFRFLLIIHLKKRSSLLCVCVYVCMCMCMYVCVCMEVYVCVCVSHIVVPSE